MKTPRKRIAFPTPRRRVKHDEGILKTKKDEEIQNLPVKARNKLSSSIKTNTNISNTYDVENNKVLEKSLLSNKVQDNLKSNKKHTQENQKVKSNIKNPSQSDVSQNSKFLKKKFVNDDKLDSSIVSLNDSIIRNEDNSLDYEKNVKIKNYIIKSNAVSQKLSGLTKKQPRKSKKINTVSYNNKEIILEIPTKRSDSESSSNDLSKDGKNEYNICDRNFTNLNEIFNQNPHKIDNIEKFLEKITILRREEHKEIQKILQKNKLETNTNLLAKFFGLNIEQEDNIYKFNWSITEKNIEKKIDFNLLEGKKEYTYSLQSYSNIDVPETFRCIFTFDEDMLMRFMFNIYEILLAKIE